MKSWNSGELQRGFARTIIGFDVRVRGESLIVEAPGLAIGKSIQIGRERWMPSTIDSEVWSRALKQDHANETNGLNLFPTASVVRKASEGNNAAVVAFDLPSDLVTEMASTFGLSRNVEFDSHAWDFLGYDVVDARTQSSAIYSFDWTRDELIHNLKSVSYDLNGYGLVADESRAIRHAMESDERVKEHAPFAPCGVWRSRA